MNLCDQRREGQLAAGVGGATGDVGEQLNSLLQDCVVRHKRPLMPSGRCVSLWCWWPQALAPFARCVGASARGSISKIARLHEGDARGVARGVVYTSIHFYFDTFRCIEVAPVVLKRAPR